MLELFLTSFVKSGADFERASAILHGLTNMPGWESKHRVLFFSGPLPPKGFSNLRSIPPQQGPQGPGPQGGQRLPHKALWDELHQNLSKISFVVQARYEVFGDRDFAGAESAQEGGAGADQPVDFNKTNGTLRWTDFPKPAEKHLDRAPITQRKKIEIPDQKNLIAILKDNNHRFKSEAIEESISYFSNNIEYTFQRHYHLPAHHDTRGPQPLPGLLPPISNLQLVDESGTWTLLVKIVVQEDNSPEKVGEALEELVGMAMRRLGGVFDWKVLDRRAHDTRMAQPLNNMPAPLPQTQRVRG